MCTCKRTSWAEVFNNNAHMVVIGLIVIAVAISEIFTKGCP